MQKLSIGMEVKKHFLSFVNNPISKETAECFNKRIDTVLRKLLARREYPLDSFLKSKKQ